MPCKHHQFLFISTVQGNVVKTFVLSHSCTLHPSISASVAPLSVNKMAKAPSKKQNNRADPLSKKAGKKDGKEGQSSKDPKSSHLCKYSLPYT